METPSRHSFSLNGTTLVFPVPTPIKGENYCRVEVDGNEITDRSKYDIVNNAIVFINSADVPNGSQLDILVVQSDEAIGLLGSTTNMDICADNIADINTVADGMADVNVATANIADITTVATNIADVNVVEDHIANVDTVATNISDVDVVATNIADVTTVATNISDVITVANDLNEAISEVETVADDLNEAISEIEVVSDNITDVQTVGTNITDVNTVATDIANVNTTATDITNVNTVATNIADVNVTATNIQAVIDAYGNANAAAASELAAAASEAAAAASYDDFDDRYLGDKIADPSTDNDGNPLLTGALYFNSSDNTMRVYDGSVWIAAYASLSGALIATNNLNDLTDLAQARTNLEVPHIQGDVFTGDVEAPTFIGDFDGAITDLCKNVTTGTLLKGTPVYQSGTAGNAMEVQAADASSAATMPAVGVVGEDIGAGLEGRIILFGKIRGVDTSSFSEGDTIYVGVGGGYTNTAPTGEGNLIQNLGRVLKVHATNGGGMVMGAGRSNATPNLNQGNIFLGDANNQSTTVALSSVANLYVHPTTSGNVHLPSGGSTDQILGWAADGTGQWVDNPPAVVTSATAPASPYLGMYWLDSSVTPHRLNVYNKMHDGTNDWTWVYINRMPSAAGVTASTNPQLTPSGTANVSFSGASDPDVGHAWDGVGLTWEVINISNAWITTAQSSVSNTMNPTFTFQGSSSINTSGTFTYDIRVTDAQGHQNVKTGFSGSFINQVNLTLGGYDTGNQWYYDSGTIAITVGYINVPSGMPLTQYCYTNLFGDDYIDWISIGGVTVHNGNWSGSRTECHTGTWNINSGNQAVQVGLMRGYESNDRMYVSSWSFRFN